MSKLFYLLSFCMVLTSCLSGESFEVSTIYLTWDRDPLTTMTVQWLTKNKEESDPTVRYKERGSAEWRIQHGQKLPLLGSDYYVNTVRLSELTPQQHYSFRIDSEIEEFLFRTMPSTNEKEIRFVVGGDMYHDTLDEMNKTSLEAAKRDPDFVVIGGDIAYVYSTNKILFYRWIEWVQAWHNFMVAPDKRLIPVLAVIGNHDLIGGFDQNPLQANAFSTLFPMPGKRTYDVIDFGNYLSLFLLDSGHAYSVSGAQKDWLRAALEDHKGIKNKFAIYHVPAYPSVRNFRNEKSAQIRTHWVPFFESYGIKVAFEHHDHAYKRSYPLLQGKVHPRGVIYLGDGAWGVDKPRDKARKTLPFYLAKFVPMRHFILVTIQNNEDLFQTINLNGVIIDELKLQEN